MPVEWFPSTKQWSEPETVVLDALRAAGDRWRELGVTADRTETHDWATHLVTSMAVLDPVPEGMVCANLELSYSPTAPSGSRLHVEWGFTGYILDAGGALFIEADSTGDRTPAEAAVAAVELIDAQLRRGIERHSWPRRGRRRPAVRFALTDPAVNVGGSGFALAQLRAKPPAHVEQIR
jgi:hypothetical protein